MQGDPPLLIVIAQNIVHLPLAVCKECSFTKLYGGLLHARAHTQIPMRFSCVRVRGERGMLRWARHSAGSFVTDLVLLSCQLKTCLV